MACVMISEEAIALIASILPETLRDHEAIRVEGLPYDYEPLLLLFMNALAHSERINKSRQNKNSEYASRPCIEPSSSPVFVFLSVLHSGPCVQ